MARYEYVEGSSSKFWEIVKSKDGKSYTTTWGKIGTKGQSKTKKFKHQHLCNREHEKLVQEKLGKGYLVVTPNAPARSKTKPKANAELEAALAEAVDDADRWLVYADWLQEAGDVRGELIALGAAGKKAAAKKLAAANVDALWGDAKYLSQPEPFRDVSWLPGWKGAKPLPLQADLTTTLYKYGFIDTVTVTGLDEAGHVARAVETLIASPIGRFVRSVHLQLDERYSGPTGQPSYEFVIAGIARAKPAALRVLSMSAGGYQLSWTNTGSLGPLWKVAPRLEHLSIEMGRVDLGKQIDLPKLRSLRIMTGGLDRANLVAIGKATWPELTELVLYLGRPDYGGNARAQDVKALLANPKHFPKLQTLALCNADIQDEVVREIVKTPLVKQLKVLDLSRGTLVDGEVTPILQNAAKLKHLTTLDLADNYLSPELERALKKAFGKAFVGGSRFQEMESERAEYANEAWAKDATFRYTAIGE